MPRFARWPVSCRPTRAGSPRGANARGLRTHGGALQDEGMTFAHVVRTWFYLDDILNGTASLMRFGPPSSKSGRFSAAWYQPVPESAWPTRTARRSSVVCWPSNHGRTAWKCLPYRRRCSARQWITGVPSAGRWRCTWRGVVTCTSPAPPALAQTPQRGTGGICAVRSI